MKKDPCEQDLVVASHTEQSSAEWIQPSFPFSVRSECEDQYHFPNRSLHERLQPQESTLSLQSNPTRDNQAGLNLIRHQKG